MFNCLTLGHVHSSKIHNTTVTHGFDSIKAQQNYFALSRKPFIHTTR